LVIAVRQVCGPGVEECLDRSVAAILVSSGMWRRL
jgi:hypothetical protein